MPIYEYQCTACGRILEIWQKFSEPPLTMCPQCGGSLYKLISACAFHLKGSGWYVSDYAGKRQVTEAPASSQENGGTAETKEAGGTKEAGAAEAGTAKAGDQAASAPPPKFS